MLTKIAESSTKNLIVLPITPDGDAGFDEFNQLVIKVDNTYHYMSDVRGCTCYICGKGWNNTAKELLNQSVVQGRDVHRSCLDGYSNLNAYYEIQKAVIAGGFLFSMEEVPARYPHSTPWQRITVLLTENRADSGFRIVLGRRKRVWELRIHNIGDLTAKFADLTDNTMGYREDGSEYEREFGPYFYIHAWTEEEMVTFLKIFHASIPAKIARD